MSTENTRFKPDRRTRAVLLVGLALITVVVFRNAWVCDDAYITFRTSFHLVEGYGLRWNIAERVQTYTNPLWMFVMALAYLVTNEFFYTCLALGLGILVIYMVLAAQFESLVHPLTVMLALPLAMVGAIVGLLAAGHTLNLFSMIGILLLFGLVTKNSILLVDYANQLRREEGMDKVTAMRTAAPVRLRPVLMTAISMIFGVLPAAFGIGPGAETRAPMAVAAATGMFSSMLLTLAVVPVFYILFDDAADWVKRGFKRIFGSKDKPVEAT